MKVRVVGQRVLIKRDSAEEKIGSFYIPEETRKKERMAMDRGTVIGMGVQAYKDCEMRDVSVKEGDVTITQRQGSPWCQVGDRVLYQRYSGMRIPDNTAQD